jgi:hypothetical protein
MPICQVCRISFDESKWFNEEMALCSYTCWCQNYKGRLLIISVLAIVAGILLYDMAPMMPIFPFTVTLLGIMTAILGLFGFISSIYGFIISFSRRRVSKRRASRLSLDDLLSDSDDI